MTELSNAVTVLIARMESHPEDFAVDDGELYSKSKFGEMVHGLYALTEVDTSLKNAFWYLNDADKQALADAWKKYHYTKFEKRVMEKIFDDGEGERELAKVQMQLHQAQIRAQLQGSMLQATQPGQIQHLPQSAQNSYPYVANQAQQGSRGFLSGIFK
jgi:transcriptional regulator with AAA-type ATPase domain